MSVLDPIPDTSPDPDCPACLGEGRPRSLQHQILADESALNAGRMRSMKQSPEKYRVEQFMEVYDCTQETAEKLAEVSDASFELGRKVGQREAQRFLRLTLGLEPPTADERAYWNNPVPLQGT